MDTGPNIQEHAHSIQKPNGTPNSKLQPHGRIDNIHINIFAHHPPQVMVVVIVLIKSFVGFKFRELCNG